MYGPGISCARMSLLGPWSLAILLVFFLKAMPVSSEAGMVDTVQYGNIQTGMKEKEVIERLGPPDRVQERQKSSECGKSKRACGKARIKRLIYTGTNPASGQKITTTIFLEKGKVVDKRRSYD